MSRPKKSKPSPAQQLGAAGGRARAARLSAERRREIARHAIAERWRRVREAKEQEAAQDA